METTIVTLLAGFVAAALVLGFMIGAPKLYWRWRAGPTVTPRDPATREAAMLRPAAGPMLVTTSTREI
jgi:hypothetical protein